jgi:hypothetical protein
VSGMYTRAVRNLDRGGEGRDVRPGAVEEPTACAMPKSMIRTRH